MEQLALAAIDVGRIDVADVRSLAYTSYFEISLTDEQECIHLLQSKFPGSPRVDTLEGIRVESTSTPDAAVRYYRELLDADPAHGVRYSLHLSCKSLGR